MVSINFAKSWFLSDVEQDIVTSSPTVMTGRWNSKEDFRSEEISHDELTTYYRELCNKSEEVYQIRVKQRMIIAKLKAEKEEYLADNSELQNKVTILTSQLDNVIQGVRMLNNGSDVLDDILQESEVEMSLVGELTYFLGLQVKQMNDSIFISQSKYPKNIMKKFGMENASHKRTPAHTHLKLSKDEEGIVVDQSSYKSMIGSLFYLTSSRPDITFVMGSMLIGYCDADWDGSVYDRKSTSDGSSGSQLIKSSDAQKIAHAEAKKECYVAYCIQTAVDMANFDRISHTKSANEAWDILVKKDNGLTKVKDEGANFSRQDSDDFEGMVVMAAVTDNHL
ncbi:uncharacterized protein LOC131626050 [Vicia villosa]|uniref:uncharacterized protein LOC131626050 n=1 Tax=Vicia villosa TaxID=3911 RepID=UPI00273B7821|nr:uncharacterized protein LOC131626050 [Vicia villosa]